MLRDEQTGNQLTLKNPNEQKEDSRGSGTTNPSKRYPETKENSDVRWRRPVLKGTASLHEKEHMKEQSETWLEEAKIWGKRKANGVYDLIQGA